MIEKIIGQYNITVEQFTELVDDLEDNHKHLYNKHVDDAKKITKEYEECKILLNNTEIELQELEASLYIPKINKNIPEQVELLKISEQLHTKLISNRRKMLNMDLVEEQAKLNESRLELIEQILELVIKNIININESALDRICEQL